VGCERKCGGCTQEEAVKTYTHLIEDIDRGKIPEWSSAEAPELAKKYWKLHKSSTMRDLILAVRADEASHSHVNHTFANIGPTGVNPFRER
jgi:D-Tyr-tRNAtyr deacylase